MMPADQKLVDPKLAVDKSKEEAQKEIEEMVLKFLIFLYLIITFKNFKNTKLAPLHGTRAFREFSKNKPYIRIPKVT